MGKEEQIEEREVLDSIFPDEITDVSETEFRVSIELEVIEANEEDIVEPPTMILSVSYPENYPDEAPRLDLSNPPNAPKHKHIDVQEDKDILLSALSSTIEENLGMAMIFTLVTTLKEEAESLIASRQAEIRAQQDAERAEAEAEENRKFEGTKVTPETFMEWSNRFKDEIKEAKKRDAELKEAEEKKKRGPKEERKLTGRELWESGIATKAFDDDDEGVDYVEVMRKLRLVEA